MRLVDRKLIVPVLQMLDMKVITEAEARKLLIVEDVGRPKKPAAKKSKFVFDVDPTTGEVL
jgi:hypothetical protein